MITIKQYPSSYIMPVYNTIAFTVDSDNKTECSFKYICDVYVNGSFVKRLKLFPSGANGYATFKVERILEDFVSYDIKNNLFGTYLFSKNQNSLIDYELKFGEEYDPSAQCDQGTTIYDNLKSSSDITSPPLDFSAFNGALQKKEWLLWSDSNYTANDPESKFLTNMPERALVTFGSQLTFSAFNEDIRKLRVKTYNDQGILIGTYTFTNPYNSVNDSTDRLIILGVGPENLNNSTLLSGSQPVITTSIKYYTVQLLSSGDAVCSEEKRIDLDYRYSKFEHHRVWFLNRLGCFDSYTYTLKGIEKVNTSRNEFTKIYGQYSSGSPNGIWDYDMSDRGRKTLSVNAQKSKTWNSNWLTEDESLWMEELFTSPEVYEIETNPIICFNYVEIIDTGDPFSPLAVKIYIQPSAGVGDDILIMDSLYDDLNGIQTISQKDNESITIIYPFGVGYPIGNLDQSSGSMISLGFNADLKPLIFSTNSYEKKEKNNIKNINYSIDVEDSDRVNTQRN